MAQLIDELLTLARADQHAPVIQEFVDLTALARRAVEPTRTAHPDREIVAAVDNGLATRGDAAQLLRVIRKPAGQRSHPHRPSRIDPPGCPPAFRQGHHQRL